jgi:hypothetical protein
MSDSLPERPNLEQLKKQAKSLLRAAQANDAAALDRFAALPASLTTYALHDAQSVIAREHGFPSWNALREEVEARTLSFDAAVDEFVRCATGSAPDRAKRLLELYPRIAAATLQTALVLGDAAAVDARLRDHPELVTKPGGPQNWEPLLYACHTCMHRETPARVEGLVAIVRQLCALGANPNAEYHWNWHKELPRTALWAALCEVRHLPLAEVLLQSGANPTDGVSTHIPGGLGDVASLELLSRYGVDLNGIPGGVPPLAHILQWAENPAGPRWLLEHGADPNLAWGEAGEAPLHLAARRWDLAMVELLMWHGADPLKRRTDGCTAHTLAELAGNHDIATWLLAHGAKDELSAVEQFAACCARGDRAAAEAMLAAQPSLRTELRPEHHVMLHRHAESGNAAVLETMLACGFDPQVRSKENFTALHLASRAGYADAVRVLLRFGAPVNAPDGWFSATPLVWAAEGRSYPRPGTDHVAVARLLIAAGSELEWTPPEHAPHPEHTLEGLIEIRRAAEATD